MNITKSKKRLSEKEFKSKKLDSYYTYMLKSQIWR